MTIEIENKTENRGKNSEKVIPSKEQLITIIIPLLLRIKRLIFFLFIKSSSISVRLLYADIPAQRKKELKTKKIIFADSELNNRYPIIPMNNAKKQNLNLMNSNNSLNKFVTIDHREHISKVLEIQTKRFYLCTSWLYCLCRYFS